MSNAILNEFSDELKNIRKKKKITLEQISNRTRIDIKYLEAIESGNFSVMPDVYIRAFLKEYAEFIGLDADETMQKYKLAQSGKLYNEPQENIKETLDIPKTENQQPTFVSEDLEKPPLPDENKTTPILYYIFTSVILLIFIYFIYYSFLKDKSVENIKEKPFAQVLKVHEEQNVNETKNTIKNKNSNKIDPDKIVSKSVESLNNATISDIMNNRMVPENIQQNKLKLTIIGLEKSWMRVVVDNKQNNEFIIDEGIRKSLYGNKQFYLHIGNSAGVQIFLNGKELNFKKNEGRVRKFIITRNGIKYLKRKTIQPNEY